MTVTPLELLKKELKVLEKALTISKQKFIEGKIDLCLHETHVKNLEPKISSYKLAIRVLETYL